MTPSNMSNVLPKDGNGDDEGMDDMGFGDNNMAFGNSNMAKDLGLSSAVDSQEQRDKVGSMVFEDQSANQSMDQGQSRSNAQSR